MNLKSIMTIPQTSLLLLLTCVLAAPAAQIPNLEPSVPNGITAIPTVAFGFDLTGADPSHYDIAVEAKGRAAYNSVGHLTADSPGSAPGTPYMLKFTMSPATCHEIFELAQRARYFEKSVAYTKGRLANMGTKTLTYSDEKIYHQSSYNYSVIPAVQQLTDIFQDISITLEAGRHLEFLYKYEKLGLDDQLKTMEQQAKENHLLELHAIAPLLQQVAADDSVLNIARQRARHLLRLSAQQQAAATQASNQ